MVNIQVGVKLYTLSFSWLWQSIWQQQQKTDLFQLVCVYGGDRHICVDAIRGIRCLGGGAKGNCELFKVDTGN